MSDKKTSTKKRNWAFVCYPDSLPADWVDMLQRSGLSCCISPLHDKDINADGTPKKPHYHVIVCYAGPTSFSVVKNNLTDMLNAPVPQALEQVRGYYRYLTHMDNPEKYQYSSDDIRCLGGFNISNFIELTKSEIFEIKKKVQTLIRDKNMVEYAELLDYLLDESMFSELEVAQNNTLLFNNYIRSRRHRMPDKVKTVLVDETTGEIIEPKKNHKVEPPATHRYNSETNVSETFIDGQWVVDEESEVE